jgi:hypothetical protein
MSTKETKSALPEIKPAVRAAADAIIANVKANDTFDTKGGSAKAAKEAYVGALPEGQTEASIQQVREIDTNWMAGTALAAKELGMEAMKKNKALEHFSLTVAATGKDAFEAQFTKSKQVPNRLADGTTDGTKEQFGSVTARFDMYGAGNRGQLKAVKEHAKADALAAYGK